ncbi:MAG: exonuclease domain-containing protein [Pseudomonadota bacterium]|nr:exonuclease domain-containing protein [Pseudomonadota bacterium]
MADLSAFPSRMVLLDCETTGGRASRDRMTELALIQVDDGVVVDRWQTLINPGVAIPPWITRLTGISNPMIEDAPRFEDIAPALFERLQDRVIVAHNARFDYSFLKQSFQRCGYQLSSKTLCSVRLSRKLFPEHRYHGLDRIIERLGIEMDDRHRAMADTEVILAFFQYISDTFPPDEIESVCKQLLKRPSLPSHISQEQIDALPDLPGIYRFLDAEGVPLYIGKSVNIRERVLSHFSQDHQNSKELDISKALHHIEFEQTPSDFGAQLLENTEIKLYSPRFNRRQTKSKTLYQISLAEDAEGLLATEVVATDMTAIEDITRRYGLFRSRKQAQNTMLELIQTHQLCQKLCGLEKRQNGACFGFQLKKCKGACCGKENAASYNLRLRLALDSLKNQQWPWPGPVIIEEHPLHEDWDAVHYHLVDQWRYLGQVKDEADCQQLLNKNQQNPAYFDRDSYKILVRFLLNPDRQKHQRLVIKPFSLDQTELV